MSGKFEERPCPRCRLVSSMERAPNGCCYDIDACDRRKTQHTSYPKGRAAAKAIWDGAIQVANDPGMHLVPTRLLRDLDGAFGLAESSGGDAMRCTFIDGSRRCSLPVNHSREGAADGHVLDQGAKEETLENTLRAVLRMLSGRDARDVDIREMIEGVLRGREVIESVPPLEASPAPAQSVRFETAALRAKGMCGAIIGSPPDERACILPLGHGPHGGEKSEAPLGPNGMTRAESLRDALERIANSDFADSYARSLARGTLDADAEEFGQ